MTINSPIKWHGGKSYLADSIVGLMPQRCSTPNSPTASDNGWLHYVEPFAGGLSVLLSLSPDGISEVVNDLSEDLTNFWRVLQKKSLFKQFVRIVECIPFSETEYSHARVSIAATLSKKLKTESVKNPSVERAVNFFVLCRQSLAGRMGSFAPLSRNRVRRGMNEQASAWLTAISGLPEVHERLKRVVILNQKAIDVIAQQDGARTLFYLDPPYMHETRVTTGEYRHEMLEQDHLSLLETLARVKGRFLLSGYQNEMYNEFAKRHSWRRTDIAIDNKASSKRQKDTKVESIWTNY